MLNIQWHNATSVRHPIRIEITAPLFEGVMPNHIFYHSKFLDIYYALTMSSIPLVVQIINKRVDTPLVC